jgi:HSP20 family protein
MVIATAKRPSHFPLSSQPVKKRYGGDTMFKEKKGNKNKLQKTTPAEMTPSQDVSWPLRHRNMLEEMDRFFDNPFEMSWWHPFRMRKPMLQEMQSAFEGKTPRVDIIEEDDRFLLNAELPGVDKKDLKVTVTGTSVTIEATSSKEKKEQKGEYYHQEISKGSFSRTINLPSEVKEDLIQAKFDNGILTLKMPKVEKTKRTEIKVE